MIYTLLGFFCGLSVGLLLSLALARATKKPTYVVVSERGGEVMRFGDAYMDDLILCVERRRTNDMHKGETP